MPGDGECDCLRRIEKGRAHGGIERVSLERETMRRMVFIMVLMGCLALAPSCPAAWAAEAGKTAEAAKPVKAAKPVETGKAAGAGKAAETGKKSTVTERNKERVNTDAAARYQEYLEREKAVDERASNSLRTKIEGKYKGYVRPRREKKAPKK